MITTIVNPINIKSFLFLSDNKIEIINSASIVARLEFKLRKLNREYRKSCLYVFFQIGKYSYKLIFWDASFKEKKNNIKNKNK